MPAPAKHFDLQFCRVGLQKSAEAMKPAQVTGSARPEPWQGFKSGRSHWKPSRPHFGADLDPAEVHVVTDGNAFFDHTGSATAAPLTSHQRGNERHRRQTLPHGSA